MVKKDWEEDLIAREKLLFGDMSALSDVELFAVIIGKGDDRFSACDIAKQILQESKNNLSNILDMNINAYRKISGLNTRGAALLVATGELARRIKLSNRPAPEYIKTSADVMSIFIPILSHLKHEECWCVYLTGGNRIIDRTRISYGATNGSIVDIKIIIKKAIDLLASGIIMVHNHPSGNAEPSDEDIVFTEKLKEAASLLDITLIDHIIFSADRIYSFREYKQSPFLL